jgi:hypothetical protein
LASIKWGDVGDMRRRSGAKLLSYGRLREWMHFLAGKATGARDVLIVRFLGISPSETPAEDDVCPPHVSQALGSRGLP